MFIALLLSAACSAPQPLDQVAWLEQLYERRPALMGQHVGSIDDPAWQALVIRPAYRDRLLASDAETYEGILRAEYDAAERASDAAWADAHRASLAAFTPHDGIVPHPDTRGAVRYYVGKPAFEEGGYTYKVFFEVDDFQRALSPERYRGFIERLAAAGFVGASKVSLVPGLVRFQYNNAIVYAPTIELALCAEEVGRSWFGDDALHVARGVDGALRGELVDWHHFLLGGGWDTLPAEIQAFVRDGGKGACPR